MTCLCQDVAVGSYDHTVTMRAPHIAKHGGLVGIDVCIATEIAELWHHGVHTAASCCGHGQWPSWVMVFPGSEDAIRRLGYEEDTNQFGYEFWYLRTGTKLVTPTDRSTS